MLQYSLNKTLNIDLLTIIPTFAKKYNMVFEIEKTTTEDNLKGFLKSIQNNRVKKINYI